MRKGRESCESTLGFNSKQRAGGERGEEGKGGGLINEVHQVADESEGIKPTERARRTRRTRTRASSQTQTQTQTNKKSTSSAGMQNGAVLKEMERGRTVRHRRFSQSSATTTNQNCRPKQNKEGRRKGRRNTK